MKIKNKYKNNINIYLLFMKYIDNTVQNVFADICWHLFDNIQ